MRYIGMKFCIKTDGSRRLAAMLLCLLLTLSPASLAEQAAFAPGEPHTHTLDFKMWFETMSAQSDACTLSIHEDIYDAVQADALLERLSEDLEAIRALTGAALKEHTVYVTKTLFAGVQCFENRVYCRAEDIESGAYLEYLIAASLGLEERWKAVGLEKCLTDEREGAAQSKGLALRLHFGWSGDMELLSLSEAHFAAEFTDSYERNLARQTAGLLCRYILENHGFSALAGPVGDELRTEWLQSIGVDRSYADPYGGLLDGFTWETSRKYPLILTSPKGDVFYLAPLPGDMETPAQVRAFMYEAIAGPQKVIDGLRADAPEYADYMEQNFAHPIKYYIEPDQEGYSYANWASREIHVGFTSSIIHETMHILTRVHANSSGYYMDQWKIEGIAEYLTMKYGPSAGEKESIFRSMTVYDLTPSKRDSEQDALLKQTILMANEFYQEQAGGLPECAEEVDAFLYSLSMAKALQAVGNDEWNSVGDMFNNLNGKNVSQRFVNGLTYEESLSFTDYVIRTYSLEKFLDFCMEENAYFEDFYDVTYEEAMEGWYRDMFGAVGPDAE